MYFTRPCQYAIRALVHLASHQGESLCQAQEIAAAEELPAPTLASILKTLGRAGLVQSKKGPRGGFFLARPADRITLYQIVAAVDRIEALSECAIGLPTCSDVMPCPVHNRVQEMRARFIECLHAITVDEMATTITQQKQVSREK